MRETDAERLALLAQMEREQAMSIWQRNADVAAAAAAFERSWAAHPANDARR